MKPGAGIRSDKHGLCERFIRTFKEECTWQHRFDNLAAARAVIARYIEHYNTQRTHSALKYNTPRHTYLTLCTPPINKPPEQQWLLSNFEGSITLLRILAE